MTDKQAMEILKEYNTWRRGSEVPLISTPKEIGAAIDKAIFALANAPESRA